MASQPPWEQDDRPPWEIDDVAGASESAPTTREQFMAQATSLPKGSPERERALNMAVRLSEPGAAGAALTATGAMASLPLSIPAAKAAGWGLVGGAGGAALGGTAGGAAEKVGAPKGTAKVLSILGGLAGGGIGAVGKKPALTGARDAIKSLWTTPRSKESLALAERRIALAEKKFAAKQAIDAARAGKKSIASDVEGATTASRVAREVPKAVPADADMGRLVLSIQEKMGTVKGRREVQELIAQMSPGEAAQIKALLKRGVAQPGTTASGGVRSAKSGPSLPAGFGEELARMLGQIE